MKHIHILGIGGTFMAGLALIAQESGFHVTGSDHNIYPPMSDQLTAASISVYEGYDSAQLQPVPDLIVIGNALSRGNPAVEYVLAQKIPYTSGPQWLADHILKNRWVLAVAGTHGKTTTSSLLAWILEYTDRKPGYLIGGICKNLNNSARLGQNPYFVIEADEYDTAFFDKRSKFIHYRPQTLILNNLEYDHGDIFPDLKAIQQQVHYLIRTVANNGLIIMPQGNSSLNEVLNMACWTPVTYFSANREKHGLTASLINNDGSSFEVWDNDVYQGQVNWQLLGHHNVNNALAAIRAALHIGIPTHQSCLALARFQGVKRRLEIYGEVGGITLYDDFAHHPTAIRETLYGLRAKVGNNRLIVVLELGSNSMKLGIYQNSLASALIQADQVVIYHPKDLPWSLDSVKHDLESKELLIVNSTQKIIDYLLVQARIGDHIVIMSNRGFDNLHQRLLTAFKEKSV
ncbi:UDP-N-acetylmuramate:L-alanyl-gamma-D-glutamyl-meso-diaminopimelate ligase [Candidatus Nitrosacidococcus tergens]|uniref:UDP-N-acetylmuramate--L-alanyl-gamma-D-glutamyl-meso-2,6-diaminoheptandioate ligase n=1 Tax=Candidatus Nitrosacidococcus tergens TaxID=553981 RepID=A0A7G1Q8L1_9GAMM|nr:UDP-N-acetylmuramate:L-alanyl-gamma-D-glutamyl-meso-diaminopimelate ligase [Candidatus Nitrosacidococcus tergens]CAB1274760.1 UDP-N-acetylmuramate:L-alanyl-gamma-D-glutamyl-meso-diaminopimelate ligase [Candidatus Nitrosacidococcus tergens]